MPARPARPVLSSVALIVASTLGLGLASAPDASAAVRPRALLRHHTTHHHTTHHQAARSLHVAHTLRHHWAPAPTEPAPSPVVLAPAPAAPAPVAPAPAPVAPAPAPVAPAPAPVAPAPVAPAPVAKAGPVFGSQFHGLWSSYTDAQRETVLTALASHGVKTVRIDLSWAMLQPTSRSSYDPWGVGFADKVIGQARAHGLSPLVTLWMTPSWANGGAGDRALPTDPADYARAARWAADRWAGKVAAWEVWNEPNSNAFMTGADPVAYARLLKAAYPAFHAGDPDTTVVLGGPEYVDVGWVARVLAAGATDSFDVMGVHPYMGMSDAAPGTPDDGTEWTLTHVAVLHDLLVRVGRADAKVWFTEFGWSNKATAADAPNWNRGVTATQQASYLQQTVRLVRSTMPYVTAVYWYEDLVGIEPGFNGGFGLVRADGSATPALAAVATA